MRSAGPRLCALVLAPLPATAAGGSRADGRRAPAGRDRSPQAGAGRSAPADPAADAGRTAALRRRAEDVACGRRRRGRGCCPPLPPPPTPSAACRCRRRAQRAQVTPARTAARGPRGGAPSPAGCAAAAASDRRGVRLRRRHCARARAATPSRSSSGTSSSRRACWWFRWGRSCVFPNQDTVIHNVFSTAPGNSFDLGSVKGGETSPPVVLLKPGPVEIFCNIHSKMRADVLVVPNSHWTRVAADGSFSAVRRPGRDAQDRALEPDAEADVAAGGRDAEGRRRDVHVGSDVGRGRTSTSAARPTVRTMSEPRPPAHSSKRARPRAAPAWSARCCWWSACC